MTNNKEQNNKKGEAMTVDDLAGIIKETIADKMATKDDLKEIEKKMATKEDMNKRFDKVDKRLDTIEKNQGRDERRVTKLEDDMRVVKTTVGIED